MTKDQPKDINLGFQKTRDSLEQNQRSQKKEVSGQGIQSQVKPSQATSCPTPWELQDKAYSLIKQWEKEKKVSLRQVRGPWDIKLESSQTLDMQEKVGAGKDSIENTHAISGKNRTEPRVETKEVPFKTARDASVGEKPAEKKRPLSNQLTFEVSEEIVVPAQAEAVFPDIDEVTDWLTEMADELPDAIFEGLNMGIRVSEEVCLSPQSDPSSPLYILGIYSKNNMGRQIVIYYGSFARSFGYLKNNPEKLKERFRHTLHHELTHHLEHQGREFDLEFEDHLQMQDYRYRLKKRTQGKK